MKLMTSILVIALFATGAMAETATFSWEDGASTALGTYGNVGVVENVSTMANSGTYSLHMTEDPLGGTPQVFVAWITDLTEGDVVSASFYSYDETPDSAPSSRIWGHYTENGDIEAYAGSAGGNNTYTAGIGWEEQTHSWTVSAGKEALCIEFRMYSADGLVDYYVDDVTVTAPDHATIYMPNQEPVSTSANSLSSVKALFR